MMKICFFGNISDALEGRTPGGGELQIALLAKALALKNHEVVIIDPFAKESFVTTEGIRLINVPDWNKGFKGIRFFRYRVPALKKILIEQQADYYYVRMRSYLHFIPYIACRRVKGKFVVAIAHDLDVLSFWKKLAYEYGPKFNLFQFLTLFIPNDIVFNRLLKRSDYVTIQHSGQEPGSKKKARGKISLYPNIFDRTRTTFKENPVRDYLVHVGSLTILKGTDKLYQLIRSLDKRNKIIIVGQPKDSRSRRIYKELRKMENVVLKGRLPHCETMELIGNAKALISTSNFEGFPNIFLEAWAMGVPVISLKVNPGDTINKYGLGIYCEGSLERMKVAIESNEACSIDRNRLISYVSEFHDFNTAGERFLDIINY